MLLNEFFNYKTTVLQDIGDDQSVPKWKSSRKTRLTLRQINKIRRIQEVSSYERALELKKIRKQYATPAAM